MLHLYMSLDFKDHLTLDFVTRGTTGRHLGKQLVMLSSFGDIFIGCTYIYTSDWSGSCSEEGPFLEGSPQRPLHVKP